MLTLNTFLKKVWPNCSNYSSTSSTNLCKSKLNKSPSPRGFSSTLSKDWTKFSHLWKPRINKQWQPSKPKYNRSTKLSTKQKTQRPRSNSYFSSSKAAPISKDLFLIGSTEYCMSSWTLMKFYIAPFLKCSLTYYFWVWKKTKIWIEP